MNTGLLLFTAFASILAGILAGFKFQRAWLVLVLAGSLAAALASVAVLFCGEQWEWRGAFSLCGEKPHLFLDGVSAIFLLLLSAIGGTGALYSHGYRPAAKHKESAARGRIAWGAFLLFTGFVLTSANGLHFLIAWELFALSGYFLITLDRDRGEVRSAGWLYLAASHAGTLVLFLFFSILASRTGSWELGPMRDHPELAPLFWLALFGFGVKAGYFPLHIWLPSAHANAPSHVSALMSGVAIKIGIFGILRFAGWLPLPEGAGWTVAAIGAASAVLGAAFALAQNDLKRLLAYCSVENVGIILLGIGFAMVASEHGHPAWGALALAGALLHVWNHGLFKALLFFGAGSVIHATGTREMSRLGGLWKRMPWTAAFLAFGAAAISGLPPFNGFVSEWLVYMGMFGSALSRCSEAWFALPAILLLCVTGALALAAFVKVCGVALLGAPRSSGAAEAHECGPVMRVPMLALVFACLFIGFCPVFFWPALARAAAAWRPEFALPEAPAPLTSLGAILPALAFAACLVALLVCLRSRRNGLERNLTWDCGYSAPTARMQYTSASFADTVNGWFDWILRPERKVHRPRGPFPEESHHVETIPETVLERVMTPVAALLLSLSTAVRRLQHGRVQSYILYLVLGLLTLSAVAYWRSQR